MFNVRQLKQLILGFSLALAACGGGGGDSAPQAVTYSGATTPATVTQSNARNLSVDAYEGGTVGSAVGMIGAVAETSMPSADKARLQQLATTLTDSVRRVVTAPPAPASPAAVGATVDETIYGYSGSMRYVVAVNEGSGAFSGTITFSAYQPMAGGVVMSGNIGFSGVYDQAAATFASLTMTITTMSISDGGQVSTVSGSITVSLSSTSESVSMSMVVKDGASGRTYWVKNYTFTVSSQGTGDLSGTYYDPIHGYVTITTLTPLTVASPDAWPTAGQLLFTGAGGTKARLTFNANGYTVEVYNTGSGTFTVVP